MSLDIFKFRQVGASPKRYHIVGCTYYNIGSSSTLGFGQIRTRPAIFPAGGHIDEVGISVTSAGTAGSTLRLGVYTSTSSKNLYPSALVADWGDVATDSTGMKTIGVSFTPATDLLYYFVVARNTGTGGIASADVLHVFGKDSTLSGVADDSGVLIGSYSGGALPDPFPVGATLTTTSMVAIAVHYDS